MQALTAEQILQASDLRYKRIKVDRWGGHVFVHELSVYDRRKLQRYLRMAFHQDKEPPVDPAVYAVAKSLRNGPNGELLFSVEQVSQLSAKSGAAVEELGEAVIKLTGLAGDSDKQAAAIVQARELLESAKPIPSDAEELDGEPGASESLAVDAKASQRVLASIRAALDDSRPDNDPTERDDAGN